MIGRDPEGIANFVLKPQGKIAPTSSGAAVGDNVKGVVAARFKRVPQLGEGGVSLHPDHPITNAGSRGVLPELKLLGAILRRGARRWARA